MKRTSFYLILILFIFQTSLQAYSSNPREFVNELVNDAINKLSDKNLNKDEKVSYLLLDVESYNTFSRSKLGLKHILHILV